MPGTAGAEAASHGPILVFALRRRASEPHGPPRARRVLNANTHIVANAAAEKGAPLAHRN